MRKTISPRHILLALMAALALCLAASVCELRQRAYLAPAAQSDFDIYYTAAQMVRAHDNLHLYDGIGSPAFFQLHPMDDTEPFARMAHRHGIPHVLYYNYPPLLADALLPLTPLSIDRADRLWRLASLAAILLACALIVLLLGRPLFSAAGLATVAGIFFFAPLWQGLHYGQITAVLCLVWCAGILLYVRGALRASALILALGVLLKITPLIVLVPVLIWRDWRWLRWFAAWIALCVLVMACVNSPAALSYYVLHAMPAMSAGLANFQSKTISSAVGLLCGIRGLVASRAVALLGKLLSVAALVLAAALAFRSRSDAAPQRRACVLAAFALLSICAAPIAWLDTYIIGCILLALLWNRLFLAGGSLAQLALLFAATVLMGVSVGPQVLYWRFDQSILFQIAPIALALLLALYALAEPQPAPRNPV